MQGNLYQSDLQADVSASQVLKQRIQSWWNAKPCGVRVSQHEIGSKSFFEEVEQHRYKQEYHIPGVVDFPRWRDKSVLEIGCGLGTDILQFARSGAHVTGIDLTPRSIELTKRRFELYGLPGRFSTGDAENLAFPDASFDLVYSHGVLHHTPNTQKAIDEVYRVLKPGGQAIVMLYNKNSYNYRINICILRASALALLRLGMPTRLLSALTSVPVDFLNEYAAALRQGGGYTVQEVLNNNTDGPGNPLSQVFTRRQVRRMFGKFESVRTGCYWLVKKNIPLIGRFIPRPIDYVLGRIMGWDLYCFATK